MKAAISVVEEKGNWRPVGPGFQARVDLSAESLFFRTEAEAIRWAADLIKRVVE